MCVCGQWPVAAGQLLLIDQSVCVFGCSQMLPCQTYAAQLGAAFCDEWPSFIQFIFCPVCGRCCLCSVDAVSNQNLLLSSFLLPLDGACGADAKVRAWMDQVAHSAVAEERPAKEAEAAQSEASSSSSRAKSSSSGGHSPSSSPRFFHSEAEHNRSRRAANYYHNYRIPNYEAAGRISYRYCTLEQWHFSSSALTTQFSSFRRAIRQQTSSFHLFFYAPNDFTGI